jgi:outer membrane usher protein FimD/PapC
VLADDDLSLAAGIGREPQRSTLTTGADYRHPRGRANGQLDFTNTSTESHTTSYNLNVATNVLGGNLLDTSRSFGIGGSEFGDAAIIVSIDGEAPQNEFDVYVDGALKGRLRAGESRPVVLPAYKTYDVRIAARGDGSVHFANDSRRVTVYPGNVASAAWTVRQVTPAFGRVVDATGRPLAFARVEGAAEPSFTDDLGYFQVELPGATTLQFATNTGPVCTIPVAPPRDAAVFVRLGTLVCR